VFPQGREFATSKDSSKQVSQLFYEVVRKQQQRRSSPAIKRGTAPSGLLKFGFDEARVDIELMAKEPLGGDPRSELFNVVGSFG
jgi:hypothetical protein